MTPFEVAKNINTKGGILPEDELDKSAFVLNRIFSNTIDTVLIANMANRFNDMTVEQQYRFYYHAITKNPRRYGKWYSRPKLEHRVEQIMQIYNYSREKAEQVYPLFEGRFELLDHMTNTGGK